MDEEQLQKLGQSFGTILLIAGLGILGMVLILAILIAWRRGHRRMREMEEQRDQAREEQPMHIDTWSSAAERLEVDAPPKQPPTDAEPPGDEREWDDDSNAPWRESLGDIPDFGEEDEDEDEDEEEEDEDEDEERP